MNGPENLQLIRHDFQRAVAHHGKPPFPRPLDVSPWLAMSALQKAIRRGREDLARNAVATLLRTAPDKLWRRIGCIAYEDVGVASLEAVGLATAALAGKQARAALGGDWAVASCVVAELSRVPKCRAADDLLMICELHPAHAEARAELPLLTTRELIAIATGRGAVEKPALAVWYALGTDRRPCRPGQPWLVFDSLCEAGWPHSIVEVAREGFRRTGDLLCPLVAARAVRQETGSTAEEGAMDEVRATETAVRPLSAGQLYRACDLSALAFASTAELAPIQGLIGQSRALEAVQFGTKVDRAGFNLFVMGGTGALSPRFNCASSAATIASRSLRSFSASCSLRQTT